MNNSPYMASSIPDSVQSVLDAGLFQEVTPGEELAPGLVVVDLAGHTVGMLGLEYRKDGRVLAAFNADLMHHPIQMAAPQCATGFCTDPDRAIATRQTKLAQYAKDGTIVFCKHFPGECAGQAVAQADGYAFRPVV